MWTVEIFLKCRSWDKGANHGPTDRRWPGNLTLYLSDACPRTPLQVAAWWFTEPASDALGIRWCVLLESLPGTPLQVTVWWSGKPSPAALTEFTRTVNQILTRNPSPCGYKMVLETMVSYASEVHPRMSTGDNMYYLTLLGIEPCIFSVPCK
ncbi:hypothetical protein OUZ56_020868 [Daphnia magna]|uniref:Uncharacterized protein n=1 Tax=Daphnia magna TaxID=35525 RepID=A0ABQ9ZGE3_9CRUS|nr:hypothetical protein OUZ56_020868 [Daphnia magna]